jgi:hypothetical protein
MNWKKYSINFDHDKRKYQIEIYAKSFKDAEERLLSLRLNARITGEILVSIPADFEHILN